MDDMIFVNGSFKFDAITVRHSYPLNPTGHFGVAEG